ncbi:hypothetical protein H17ap60334_06094 [Thermosipho africanus H17ap60334]|jgi:hypothetical protein|uniref:PilZ domain-containing protein n=1 Tax=Thermosipho africanus (strain TCF52B) TaxID=484019 RepID=B7IDV9_THEAB|nr:MULTISPECIES: PilZ domain-containing protein [Thermosipho]HCF38975.1 PilZ domain-containing protein [Thermosipho africanus]ACJ76186.1 hypothetical protein THA_1752 [Thermosipho africanus TCF52B]EKF49327.1 hypothetical protein H17ap60334_06094 [Thermosipho africanus H17ap60334]MBZ4649564.1 hypothetical protein [Thermosipho sp. (in: thermotogales)]MDK2839855.1 hypothetical protein [Thermosipho sp. (in: thermotogales)]
MTIIEFINKNLSGIYLLAKDHNKNDYQVRLINIQKTGVVEIESNEQFNIGKTLQLNIPVKEALLLFVGEVFDIKEKRHFLKTHEKVGIIQRRKEKRYPYFKRATFSNNKILIIDVSKSGMQIFSEKEMELKSSYEIAIDDKKINIIPMWRIYEEEIYRIGCKVSNESLNLWNNILNI